MCGGFVLILRAAAVGGLVLECLYICVYMHVWHVCYVHCGGLSTPMPHPFPTPINHQPFLPPPTHRTELAADRALLGKSLLSHSQLLAVRASIVR